MSTEGHNLIEAYDESYFDGGENTPGYSSYEDSWVWGPIAEILLHLTCPQGPILDWGCAKGFLVARLVERGIDGWGVDVSEYAIGKAHERAKERLRLVSRPFCQFGAGMFKTVVSFETLEHIPEEDIGDYIEEFRRVSNKWFFGTIFTEGQESEDPTHVTVHPREWWDKRFCRHGWRTRSSIVREAMTFPVFRQLGWQVYCYEKV